MRLLFLVAVYLKFTFAQYSYNVDFVFYLHNALCFIYTKFCVIFTQSFVFYLHKVLCLCRAKRLTKPQIPCQIVKKIFAKVQNTHRTNTRFAE